MVDLVLGSLYVVCVEDIVCNCLQMELYEPSAP